MENKLKEKIKKLFALAGNNPNQHEADNAMRMARKLMDKHNVSMYELGDTEAVCVTFNDGVNMPWLRVSYQAVSKLYDCVYLLDKQWSPAKHVLVGTESNRTTTGIVLEYVLSSIRETGKGKGAGFRNAMAQGVYQQVLDIITERSKNKTEVIPGTGLVLADVSNKAMRDVQDWIKENIQGVKSGKRANHSFDKRGFQAGMDMNLGPRLSNRRAIN